MTFLTRLLPAALMAALAPALPAQSQVVESAESIVKAKLLGGWREADGSHYAGIRIDLAPGWKTYWRAPGDGGIPTHASWTGSQNLNKAQIKWPRPDIFRDAGLRSVGYHESVVLPVHVSPETSGDISAKLTLNLGVCKDICIPVQLILNQTFSDTGMADAEQIKSALNSLPRVTEAPLDCTIQHTQNGYRLDVAATLPPLEGLSEASVVELPGQNVWISEPKFARDENWVISTVHMIKHPNASEIDLSTLRMTVLTTTSAVEMVGCD